MESLNMFRKSQWLISSICKTTFFKNGHISKRTSIQKNLSKNLSLSSLYSENQTTKEDPTCEASAEGSTQATKELRPFIKMILHRRQQAERSFIVKLTDKNSIQLLEQFCFQFGPIENSFAYFTSSNERMILIEYRDATSLVNLLNEVVSSNITWPTLCWPAMLPYLEFNKEFTSSTKSNSEDSLQITQRSELSPKDLLASLDRCNDISEQIMLFYQTRKLTDLEMRLRFIICHKIEWMLPKFMKHLCALPFGSSVNSFGHCNSDADILLANWNPCSNQNNIPLKFVASNTLESPLVIKNELNLLYMIMKGHNTSFSKMFPIFHARVPIIKFEENSTGLECDLSLNYNLSGFDMSEIMYSLSLCDPRVSPLILLVKSWGKEKRINVKERPGRGISNFSLAMLTLYYLMNTSPPILSSLQDLYSMGYFKHYSPEIESQIQNENTSTLEELLRGFFTFYLDFPFSKKSISLVSSENEEKTQKKPMWIENPIEMTLNVTPNVTNEEVKYFKNCCAYSLQLLDKGCTKELAPDGVWGINTLIGQTNKVYTKLKNNPIEEFFKDSSSKEDLSKLVSPLDTGFNFQRKGNKRIRKGS